MRHALRVGSFKSGELAFRSPRSFHPSLKPATEIKETDPTATPVIPRVNRPSLLEWQRKDRLVEYLIRKSTQLSSKQRANIRKMPRKLVPHKSGNKTCSHIQFITTPTADTPGTALLLHFDEKRYVLGNIHEGVQRAGLQIGARFFRAKDFFLTGKTEWRSNGGLLGLILTLADATKASALSKAENTKLKNERRLAKEEEASLNFKDLARKGRQDSNGHGPRPKDQQMLDADPGVTLHGGPNLTHTIATARAFIFRHGTPIKVIESHGDKDTRAAEHDWEPTWEDENIQVWAMALSPSGSEGDLRPGTPRKRSLGEYMSGQYQKLADADDQSAVNPRSPVDDETRNQRIREFVVSEMFSSSWRADNLVETPLCEVIMPAGLFIRNPNTRKIEKYTGAVPDGTTPLPNINVLVRQPWPGSLVNRLPPTKPSPVAMSYIVRNHKQRGKFKPEVATALKVPQGPLWSKLTKGFEVQLCDGKTITPDMVLEPGKDGAGIAVIDLPSKEYVHNLITRPEWNTEKVMRGINGVVWILGPGLSDDAILRAFIQSKPELEHIISSPDNCPNYLVQTSAGSAAVRHNQIDPIRFPVPLHSNVASVPLNLAGKEVEKASPRIFLAKRGLRVDLEPSFGTTEREVVPYLNTAEIVQETPKKVISLAQVAQREISSDFGKIETANQGLPGQDTEIVCLGTGSAVPSSHRNVAGTLLRVPGHGSYLLDCGENTLGQLKRVFTESELAEVFHDLKLIWISHLHADHHLGTTSVIRAWYEEVHGKDHAKRRRPSLIDGLLDPAKFLEEGKRLFIVGHGHMMRWLEEYSSVEDFGYDQLITLKSFPAHWKQPNRCDLEWNGLNVGFNTSKDPRVQSAIRKATSLSNLVTVAVSHCYGAQAVSLTFPNGFKFSYSGDCRPSRDLAVIGKGSTVLLHEATFDDELVGDAEAKKHSTTGEAIGVGVAMGAKRVLLTHFSQRYPKIPSMGSMQSVSVRLEDTEAREDSTEGMELPVNAEDGPLLETQMPNASSIHIADQEKSQTVETGNAGSHIRKFVSTGSNFASLQSVNKTIRPPVNDMKVGVAFDYMRIKVGDIMHLEKFTPALRELYKGVENEETYNKAKEAAKEAFSDDPQVFSPSNIKGSKTVNNEKKDTKTSISKTRREWRKVKISGSRDTDKGGAHKKEPKILPNSTTTTTHENLLLPLEEHDSSVGKSQGTGQSHLGSEPLAEAYPPDAASSDVVATANPAPNA